VVEGVAEKLPCLDESFDYALMVTTICFVDEPQKSIEEVYRILRPCGKFILGFVDKESPIGKLYQKHKAESIFYAEASFFSTNEIPNLLKNCSFSIKQTLETVFGQVNEIKEQQEPRDEHGEGSFVVVVGEKS
jgi:ubiquinone/menaquinone biosynthesis C-methylase UbiE